MKEGIPVIPGSFLLPSMGTASTFIAVSGDTPSKSRDPRQISTSPCSQLPSSLSSHHIAACSLHAGCPEERGGSVESRSLQTTRHPPPCTLASLSPALAADPEQPHLPGTPSGTKTQRAPGRAELGSCPSAGNADAQCHQPHRLQGSVTPRMGSPWDASHGPWGALLLGDVSADQQPLQRGQSVQRASGRPALHSKHHANKEMLQHPRSPGKVSPSAPPLHSPLHRGERRTSHARPQTSSRDNSRWYLLPTENYTPHKAQAPLF